MTLSLVDRARFAHLDWRDEMVEFLSAHAKDYAVKTLGKGLGSIQVDKVSVKDRKVHFVLENMPFQYTRVPHKAGTGFNETLQAYVRGHWEEVEDLVSLGRALAGGDDV